MTRLQNVHYQSFASTFAPSRERADRRRDRRGTLGGRRLLGRREIFSN
jgi:hypothetical protein